MTPDVSKESLKLDLKPTSLTFTGYSETKKASYHVELEFYEEIDVENSKTHHSARGVDMVLRKKELKEEYWPRLLKTSQKMHFLKTDFDKVILFFTPCLLLFKLRITLLDEYKKYVGIES